MKTAGAKRRMEHVVETMKFVLDANPGWPDAAKRQLEVVVKKLDRASRQMTVDGTEWAAIHLLEGVYEVSRRGEIRRIDGHVPKLLNPGRNGTGYRHVNLSMLGYKDTRPVHQIVIETFKGPRPSKGHVVNHIDGNRSNNHVDNLEWVTYAENSCHAIQAGLKRGKKKYLLTRSKYDFIQQRLKSKIRRPVIAQQLGVPKGIVDAVWSGKSLSEMFTREWKDYEVLEKS